MPTTDALTTPTGLLADLLAVQEGAIVSRVLLKKPSGNVTVFAFDAGEGLSEHTTPFDALLYAIDGEAIVTLDGETFPMGAGGIVTLPAKVPHAVLATRPFKMLLILLRS